MRVITKLILVIGFITISLSSQAQKYNYYQIFMYNFTKYIKWPASQQSGDFVIGVYGNSEIIKQLEQMATTKTVGTQKIVIKVFNSPSEVVGCHMLFLPESKSKYFDELTAQINGKPTLLITERDGLGRAGSAVNFIVQDGKLRFELNKAVAERANLKVSSDLTKLAILI